MANYSSNGTFNGLGTFNEGAPDTASYKLKASITLPTIPEGELTNSQVVATISINGGAAIFTSNPGDKGFEFKATANAGDVFNITLTSAALVDQGLNKIKTTFSISEI